MFMVIIKMKEFVRSAGGQGITITDSKVTEFIFSYVDEATPMKALTKCLDDVLRNNPEFATNSFDDFVARRS